MRKNPFAVMHGTAGMFGGLHQAVLPDLQNAIRSVTALAESTPANERIIVESAALYGLYYADWILGQALRAVPPEISSRFDVIEKCLRILLPPFTAGPSTQPAGLWPEALADGATEGWGFGGQDTLMTLEFLRFSLGVKNFRAVYLHDCADAMQIKNLSFDELWTLLQHGHPESKDEAGVIPALRKARAAGYIGGIGSGEKNVAILRQLIEADPDLWDILSATQYNMMFHSDMLDLFEWLPSAKRSAERPRIKFYSAGPNAGGALSTKNSAYCNYRFATPEEKIRAGRIWEICEKYGWTPMRAAVKFVKACEQMDGVVLGSVNAAQVTQNLGFVHEEDGPIELWQDLRKLEIAGQPAIDRRAPLPYGV